MHSSNLPTQVTPILMASPTFKTRTALRAGFSKVWGSEESPRALFKKIQILDLFLDNPI